MLLILLALLAGFLTVLAPCTISLLPVIVGGSLSGESSVKRAIVVTLSLGISVIAFTFALKASTALIVVPQSFWEYLSGAIIIVLGFLTVFPSLYDSIPLLNRINRASNRSLATGYQKQSFVGDVLVGASLGPVFSSCSPTYFLILATVLPVSFLFGFICLLAYSIGLCVTLFVVSVIGQRVVDRLGVASDPRGWFKRSLGVLFIVVGVLIFTGLMQKLELAVASSGLLDVGKIEQAVLESQMPTEQGMPIGATGDPTQTPMPSAPTSANANGDLRYSIPMDEGVNIGASPITNMSDADRVRVKSLIYPRSPEITGSTGYVNTGKQSDGSVHPVTIGQFKGKKVVLIDFWTYSCINCLRTSPYLRAWYDKYHNQGLEIIGIHTPEFAFERIQKNVEDAIKREGLKYPNVLDNDYATWDAFGNRYWPRKYLIDIDGYVVYDHAGEGDYEETERAIQKALMERAFVLGTSTKVTGSAAALIPEPGVDRSKSPETYFGSMRNDMLGNGVAGREGNQTLVVPATLSRDKLYLGGTWNIVGEYAEAKVVGARMAYRYKGKELFFVASADGGATATVRIDGKSPGALAGADVTADGTLTITEDRLYKIAHDPAGGEHTIEIISSSAGLKAYSFTFE